MNAEMAHEQIFHPEMRLSIRYADDNSELQCQQIDSFIAERVDLLIVSPNEAEEVKPAVSRAYRAGIPVIVADRQVSGNEYTAFIGGDNYAVGEQMGHHLLQLQGREPGRRLRVMEVQGLHGSTPMVWRHRGMMDVLEGHTEVAVVATATGEWFREEARRAVDSLLRTDDRIDVIVAQNDQMAIGAYEACHAHYGPSWRPYIIGVDGITGPGGGIEAILREQIDATLTYPSKGDLVLRTAAQILRGEEYARHTLLPTVLIDKDAAVPLQQIAEEIDHQTDALHELQAQFHQLWQTSTSQRMAIIGLSVAAVLVVCALVGLLLLTRYRARIEKERAEHARIVAKQQQQLADMTAALERTKATQSLDDRFVERLQQQIENHLEDNEFSVEQLAELLGVSRTHLFRRTKDLMGISPNELIRQVRLRKAHQLLQHTDMTVQQAAYATGFSSPSYFTKCYKELFGTAPSQSQKE